MSLTDTKVKNAKVTDRRYKMSDRKGLYLEVRPSGAKTWRMRYTANDSDLLDENENYSNS